jgi:hypothetical protein
LRAFHYRLSKIHGCWEVFLWLCVSKEIFHILNGSKTQPMKRLAQAPGQPLNHGSRANWSRVQVYLEKTHYTQKKQTKQNKTKKMLVEWFRV